MALIIIGLMAAAVAPLASTMMDINRANQAHSELAQIYAAITGDPEKGTYGYIGDVGKFPDKLLDLLEKPVSNPPGWNGPYLTEARVEGGVLYDPYGSPIECYYFRNATASVADNFVLISRGPDRTSTNTSATPNECSTFAGTLPSNEAYATDTANPDNVVFPPFMDNTGLLSYQHVGTLSINISNFDQNAKVNAVVPSCPHLFTITVTSIPRGTADAFSMYSNPGANSIELRQGLYHVRVTSQTSTGSLWQDRIAVRAGTTETRNLTLAGLDSSTTPDETFRPINQISLPAPNRIWVGQLDPPAAVGTVDYGLQAPDSGNWQQVSPCTQVTIRHNNSAGRIVDAFIYPFLTPVTADYVRRVNTNARYSLTVVNRNISGSASKEELSVYEEDLLVGVVSSYGSYKSKTLLNIKGGNPYTIFDKAGNLVASGTMPFANTLVNVN
jgi:hypothetical protein